MFRDANALQDNNAQETVYWPQIQTVIEVKRDPPGLDLARTVLQLCSYLRQMFRQQLDRRFLVGLTLCGTNMHVWHCDRSGLLGTNKSFDINEVCPFCGANRVMRLIRDCARNQSDSYRSSQRSQYCRCTGSDGTQLCDCTNLTTSGCASTHGIPV